VAAGDLLGVPPGMRSAGIRAMGPAVQLRVKSALGSGPPPSLRGPVLLAGRYAQSQAELLNVSEASIFPYYREADSWYPMQVLPNESGVDEINRLSVAAVDLGAPHKYPTEDSFLMVLAGAGKRLGLPKVNIKVMDKDELTAVAQVRGTVNSPNPNALPLLIVSGWDPLSIVMDTDHTDPNKGFDAAGNLNEEEADRYTLIIKDLVEATNGVYRPVFVSHNSRASMINTGQALAGMVTPRSFFGLPSHDDPGSGDFPYLDAFGFSMGGLVCRSYQDASQYVNNMVIAGTPNHGAFRFVNYLSLAPPFLLLREAIERWSPGTSDLIEYDDQLPPFFSSNPRLSQLNKSARSVPLGDLTLIAGEDHSQALGWLLNEPNDGVVEADSVFCRTSDGFDPPDTSLLNVKAGAKYEYLFGFNHFNFGGKTFRFNQNEDLKDAILHGLSDWLVAKGRRFTVTRFPGSKYIQRADSEATVEYNTFKPNAQDLAAGRDKRRIDRVVLLIYGQDEDMIWHVRGHVLPDGTLTAAEQASGNSVTRDRVLELSASASFQLTDRILRVEEFVVPLAPGQTTVNLTPKGDFGIPQ
jgi:hypothetical protein